MARPSHAIRLLLVDPFSTHGPPWLLVAGCCWLLLAVGCWLFLGRRTPMAVFFLRLWAFPYRPCAVLCCLPCPALPSPSLARSPYPYPLPLPCPTTPNPARGSCVCACVCACARTLSARPRRPHSGLTRTAGQGGRSTGEATHPPPNPQLTTRRPKKDDIHLSGPASLPVSPRRDARRTCCSALSTSTTTSTTAAIIIIITHQHHHHHHHHNHHHSISHHCILSTHPLHPRPRPRPATPPQLALTSQLSQPATPCSPQMPAT